MEMVRSESQVELQPRRFTRAEYAAMVERGMFERERVELIDGQVVQMSPIGHEHRESVSLLTELFLTLVGKRARIYAQSSFAATDDSQPEPDVFVVEPGSHWHEHLSRAFLIVETAASSLAYDRNTKARLYAASDVLEYWIVDLRHATIEVFRDRADGWWQTHTTHHRGESIAMLAFPDVAIRVDDVVPPVGHVVAE